MPAPQAQDIQPEQLREDSFGVLPGEAAGAQRIAVASAVRPAAEPEAAAQAGGDGGDGSRFGNQ